MSRTFSMNWGSVESLKVGSMRLESEGVPDPTHRRVAQSAANRHRAGAPVGGISGHRLQGGVHDGFDLVVADLAWRSTARFVEQPHQPPFQVARTPLPNGVVSDPELPSHGAVGDAVGAAEEDPGALSECVVGLRKPGPAQEFSAILTGERKRCFGTTEWHDVSLIVSADGDPDII